MISLPVKASITVLVIEDHPLMASALATVVQSMGGCRLVGIAPTPEEARRLATATQPDVITLDLRLGGSSRVAGIQLARELRGLSEGSRILVCSGFAFETDIASLADLTIEGYVTKDEPPSVIAAAIRAVAAGQTFYSRTVSQVVQRVRRGRRATGMWGLSSLDVEILHLLADGLTNEDIARRLSISRTTVARHVTTIFENLEAASRAEAVAKAAQLGYSNFW